MSDRLSTRRDFLQKGLGVMAVAPVAPPLFGRLTAPPVSAPAVSSRRAEGVNDRILVVLHLDGGNDGLNTVVPFADDAYYRARPGIAHDPATLHKLNDSTALHPNLRPLMALYERGHMAVVHAVGYPEADRSHFRAADAWHSALPVCDDPTSGWLGRYLDSAGGRYAGVHFDAAHPLALRREQPEPPAAPPPLIRVDPDGTASYPRCEVGDNLRRVATGVAASTPARVYFLHHRGFDTHTNQRGRHDRLMKSLAESVAAFWADLRAGGQADRVLMLAFSEFGRSVRENAAGGTDHGGAGPVFLFGPRVKGGVHGGAPSLADLDNGGLKHQVDFRSVYATVLQQWLETPSAPVLGGRFELLPLVSA